LERQGFRDVVAAVHGLEALEAVSRRPPDSPFHAVLSDIEMPVRCAASRSSASKLT
jgi:CheY-like chemotaxis protein